LTLSFAYYAGDTSAPSRPQVAKGHIENGLVNHSLIAPNLSSVSSIPFYTQNFDQALNPIKGSTKRNTIISEAKF